MKPFERPISILDKEFLAAIRVGSALVRFSGEIGRERGG